ncbi:unnamed protein product [Amoebophrya sp. A25]|nr:unnamed protein product [Amoebophrya sp. A25]|eukprot:GSA25T00011687001.1
MIFSKARDSSLASLILYSNSYGSSEDRICSAKTDEQLLEARKRDEIEREERRYTFETPFIAATTFTGEKPGYCFKLGVKGLGYYEDIGLEMKKKRTAASAASTSVPDSARTANGNGRACASSEDRKR